MPELNITIPVYNERIRLQRCIPKLHNFLTEHKFNSYEIIIANNGSTDDTQLIAENLATKYDGIRVLWIPQKGRGGAIKTAWFTSKAKILSYMDVDLSTDLEAFPSLINAIIKDGYDIAIGSRMLSGSIVVRSRKRNLISRFYLLLVKAILHTKLSDLQCGFKAIKKETAQRLLPLIENEGWFFDTELLILAECYSYRIYELPVKWREDIDSRVCIFKTAIEDIIGIIRLRQKVNSIRN